MEGFLEEELLNLQNEIVDTVGQIEHGVIKPDSVTLYLLECVKAKLRSEANRLEKIINLYEASPRPEGENVEKDIKCWRERYLEIVKRVRTFDRVISTKRLDLSLTSQH